MESPDQAEVDSPEQRTGSKSPTAVFLEQTTSKIMARLRDRDFSDPVFNLVVPNFTACFEFGNVPHIHSKDEWFEMHNRMARQFPEYRFEVTSISADVDAQKGRASVWAVMRVTGHPKDIARESVTITRWRRSNGQWMCHAHTGVRGIEAA